MIERPCRSSSLAREYTVSAPSPFSCETRDAIRVMVLPGAESYHFAAKTSALGMPYPPEVSWCNVNQTEASRRRLPLDSTLPRRDDSSGHVSCNLPILFSV